MITNVTNRLQERIKDYNKAVNKLKYLTAKETADFLGYKNKNSILRLCRAGTIPSVKIGNSVRIPETYLKDLNNKEGTNDTTTISNS